MDRLGAGRVCAGRRVDVARVGPAGRTIVGVDATSDPTPDPKASPTADAPPVRDPLRDTRADDDRDVGWGDDLDAGGDRDARWYHEQRPPHWE